MNCLYCGKECKNNNSLRNHERLCKLNPNKQTIISNFIKYNKKVKSGEIKKLIKNQFVKAKLEGREITVSYETRNKIRDQKLGKKLTAEHIENIRNSMKLVVEKNPESYSSKNVSGRTPIIEYNGFKLKGSWELKFAIWLDKNNIKWTNVVRPFEYFWKNDIHLYFPDFYLIDYDRYVEVKGYERERDRCKWEVVKDLLLIKKNDITKITNNNFQLKL
jgi:hypothetical protein